MSAATQLDSLAGHTFEVVGARGYRIDGHPADLSVTQVLDAGVPKPALVWWAANEAGNCVINEWDHLAGLSLAERGKYVASARLRASDPAKVRGTELHLLLERMVLGEQVEVPDRLYEAAKALTRLVDEWKLQPVLVEAPIANFRYGYAGRLDLVADCVDGKRRLLDLKSGKAVYAEACLQLAAYRFADGYLDEDGELRPMLLVDDVAVLHVTTDSAQLVPVFAGEREWRVFLHAQQTARWQRELDAASREHRPWPVGVPMDGPPSPRSFSRAAGTRRIARQDSGIAS